jgi:triosephosphate isomerase
MAGRRTLVAGNWKMNGLRADAVRWTEAAGRAAQESGSEVVLLPPFPWLPIVRQLIARRSLLLGAQACHPEPFGAHTGSVSALMLKSAGCTYVLCGHSERRRAGEDDDFVARCARAAVDAGLVPIACVGETREERREGRTREVLLRQLGAVLDALPSDSDPMVLAYEPIWAIGTGEHASPAAATQAHLWLRDRVAEGSPVRAQALRILYGGSVTPANIVGFLAAPEVDGVLVGGASLDPDAFARIIRAGPAPGSRSPAPPAGEPETTAP